MTANALNEKEFSVFKLSETLQTTLNQLGFTQPTPIQAATIPLALAGRDVLGSADTGTGKTMAYALPVVHRLIEESDSTALIITPTRELAEQVIQVFHSLINKNKQLQSVLLIGGTPIWKQFSRLERNPCLIVGTPGRINDHIQRGSLGLQNTSMLVIDEADRMLDMGFGIQLNDILAHLPAERQTFMFSATFPNNIQALSKRFLKNPERISLGTSNKPNDKLIQEVIFIQEEAKFGKLIQELNKREGSVLIFASTKMKTEKLAQRLSAEKIYAQAMHGDLRQTQRQRVLAQFREQKFRILVATDVAGRGLDVPHIEHVINYDMPQSPEDYIHRLGRTARNGANGFSLCMVSRQDQSKWKAIQRLKEGKGYNASPDQRPPRNRFSKEERPRRFKDRDDKPRATRPFSQEERPRRFKDRDDKPRAAKPFSQEERPRRFKDRDDKPRAARPFSQEERPRRFKDGDEKPREGRKFKDRNGKPAAAGKKFNDRAPANQNSRRNRSRQDERPRFIVRNGKASSEKGEQRDF